MLCLPAGALAGQASGVTLVGQVQVLDGDTLRVGSMLVRLHGLDAPEVEQMCGTGDSPMWPCGDWVRSEVRALYHGKMATCQVLDRDRYDRAVATCQVAGQDVGEILVAAGLAFAYRSYSMAYDLTEKQAVVAGAGLHGQGVQAPSDFRARARAARVAAQVAQAPQGCRIKGNISADGRHIYHVPGQQWYDRTQISELKGERWFCSEADARKAGWRAAKR